MTILSRVKQVRENILDGFDSLARSMKELEMALEGDKLKEKYEFNDQLNELNATIADLEGANHATAGPIIDKESK
jgi:hypothetical protein